MPVNQNTIREMFVHNSRKLFEFGHLDAGSIGHLRRIYTCLLVYCFMFVFGCLSNGIVAIQSGKWSMIAAFGCNICAYYSTSNSPNKLKLRLALLFAAGYLLGFNCTPYAKFIFEHYPTVITTAFLTSTLVFAGFSMSVLKSPSTRAMLYSRAILLCLSHTFLFTGILTLFLPEWINESFSWFNELIYAVMLCGYIMVETQLILDKYSNGDDDFITHSITLLFDFVQLFKQIVNILLIKVVDEIEKRKSECEENDPQE